MALTDKQEAFINEYLKCWNATKAAIAAGYSEKTARSIGSENLTKPDILERIESRKKELTMSADEVLIRLSDHGRGDMSDFTNIRNGIPFVDLAKAEQAGKLHLLKKFKVTDKSVEIELYDAQAALVHIGRFHSLFTDKTDLTSGGQPLNAPVIYLPAVDESADE